MTEFKWTSFYTEFAIELLQYKNDRKTLIDKIMIGKI